MELMRRPLTHQSSFQSDPESGQAIVEYILMVMVALSFVAIIGIAFRKSVVGMWGYYIYETTSAAPGAPSDYKLK
jgi:hypothetical protein